MKRISLVLCLLVVISFIAVYGMRYYQGLSGELFFLPFDLLPFAVGFFSFIGLLIFGIRNLFKQNNVNDKIFIACMFIIACIPVIYYINVPPAPLFLKGYTKHVSTVITPDQLQQIAAVARTLIPVGERLDPEFMSRPDLRAKWKTLNETTAIKKLDCKFARIYIRSNNAVNIQWGGGLTGIWGILINPPDNTDVPGAHFQPSERIAPGIAVYGISHP